MFSDFEMSDLSSSTLDKEDSSNSESGPNEHKYEKKKKKEKIVQQIDTQQRDSVNMRKENVNEDVIPANNQATINDQEKMRRRLQFFFMNPIEKWQAKRR